MIHYSSLCITLKIENVYIGCIKGLRRTYYVTNRHFKFINHSDSDSDSDICE